MKEQTKIPTSKVKRAAKLVSTGAKVGGNYVKYFAKKAVGNEHAKEDLDKDNAEDIYNSLSELKGSALKMAQIMSMDKSVLPKAFAEKFAMAQYSAPPLSYPLVVKTFKQQFGKTPTEIFSSFTKEAVNAASIGQVHRAELDGKLLAVKVQYPGVAESVKSDLKLVKPIAMRMLKLKENEVKQYFEEIESKLLEETDYEIELKQSMEIGEACQHLDGVVFPKYYPAYSGKRILTMDWLEGKHLKDFLLTNPSQEERNRIGQSLWRFYDFQLNNLKAIHADPHPGNFLFRPDGEIGIIDFGCVKRIPEEFYQKYFQLMNPKMLQDDAALESLFMEVEFLSAEDSPEEKQLFFEVFKQLMELLTLPFRSGKFDFGDEEYFGKVYELGEALSKRKDIRKSKNARGSKHILYINRTYFGLYSILNELKSNIKTDVSFKFDEM